MTRQKKTFHAPGLKTLITAAAFAATLGGWAALATGNPPSTTAVVAQAPRLDLPPVPTLVPLAGAAPAAPDVAASRRGALRDVSGPPAISRPAPIAITRSSR